MMPAPIILGHHVVLYEEDGVVSSPFALLDCATFINVALFFFKDFFVFHYGS